MRNFSKLSQESNWLGRWVVPVLLSATVSLAIAYWVMPRLLPKNQQSPGQIFIDRIPTSQNLRTMSPISFSKAAESATEAVVHIKVVRRGAYSREEPSSGSGVIISSSGYVVTNYHVVENSEQIDVTLSDRRYIGNAVVVGTDSSTDLALLKLPTGNYPYLPFVDSDSLSVGDWVIAVGNPFELNSTVTAGIVSGLTRRIDALNGRLAIESFIQTDAVVNHGNSGGALVGPQGGLVGVITAIMTRTGLFEGYSFAIPSNIVRKVVEDLIAYGIVQKAYVGLTTVDMTAESAQRIGLESPFGVVVDRVLDNSPADKAGIRSGDALIRLGDVLIRSKSHYLAQIYLMRPNENLSMALVRDGKTMYLKLKTAPAGNTNLVIDRSATDVLFKDLGFRLRNLTEREMRLLGKRGVVVSYIASNSVIQKTNMEVDFVLMSVNKKPVRTIEEAQQLLQRIRGRVELEGRYKNSSEMYLYVFEQ